MVAQCFTDVKLLHSVSMRSTLLNNKAPWQDASEIMLFTFRLSVWTANAHFFSARTPVHFSRIRGRKSKQKKWTSLRDSVDPKFSRVGGSEILTPQIIVGWVRESDHLKIFLLAWLYMTTAQKGGQSFSDPPMREVLFFDSPPRILEKLTKNPSVRMNTSIFIGQSQQAVMIYNVLSWGRSFGSIQIICI